MKKLIHFFLLLFFCTAFSNTLMAQEPFITTWQTTNDTITIPINPADTLVYNYDLEWTNLTNDGVGDGSASGITASHTISGLNNNDIYEIKISGDFPAIFFNNGAEKDKIQTIEQWGDIEWETMYVAFFGCSNLSLNATDAPNLQATKSLLGMFAGATSFNSDLNNWDVSNITNMYGTFFNAPNFNGDISNWNVGNVDTTYLMFNGASSFNRDISNWNVGNVIDMRNMFSGATSFNIDLSNWYTGSARNMANMFSGASSFNHSLGDWRIANVENMAGMLDNSGLSKRNYDATLTEWESDYSTPLNITLGAAGLTYCNSATSRQSLIQSYNWTINDDNLDCKPFVTTWITNDNTITIPTNNSDEPYLYSVTWTNLTQPGVGDGTQSELTGDFTIPELTNGDLYEISISGDFPKIAFGNSSSDNQSKIQTIEQWGDIVWADFSQSFYNCVNLTSNATDTPLLTNVTDMSSMFLGATSFTGDLSNWNVSNITEMDRMFENAQAFTTNDTSSLNGWDVSNVTNMSSMFDNASSFNSVLSNWNVSNVTNMRSMFNAAVSLDSIADLSSWDVSNVTNMSSMFSGATSFDSDLSNWSVSNVSQMSRMFNNASNFNSDLSKWNVGSSTTMYGMFEGAESFNSDLSNWDVRNVTEMTAMFASATNFNSDLSNWDVSNVRNMGGMFWNATSFNQSLANWNISSVNNQSEGLSGLSSMLTNSGLSTINYDSTLIGWATLSASETQIPTNINLGADSLNFCFSSDERSQLIENFAWTITDTGPNCPLPETQATDIEFSEIAHTQMNLSWTNGAGARRLVLAKQDVAVDASPADLTTYAADTVFSEGDEIGSGNFVVYNGADSSFTITGLEEGTIYHFQVFEYNGENGLEVYNTSTANGNPASEETLATPIITSFTPTSAAEDDNVIIQGENFTGASLVSFGGIDATSFTVESDTEITATVGNGDSGDVLVTTPGGTATQAGFEFIPAPIIDAFDPALAAEGDTISITGSNFTDASLLSFGGTEAASFTVESDTEITAVVGNGTSGDLLVTTPGGTDTQAGFDFIPAPIIDAFDPALAAEGDTISITGSNFTDASLLSLGGTEATSFTVESDTEITVVVGNGTSGDLLVTTPGGTATQAGFEFIPAPIISAFDPALAAEGDTISITGSNFTDASLLSFGGTEAASFTVDSDTEITAVVGNGASGDVLVTTPGGTATQAGFEFIPAPIIEAFDPASAAEDDTVTITGSNFTDASLVSFGETEASSFTVDSDTEITAIVGNGASGDVLVTTPGGTATQAGFEFIPAPIIDAFDPASAAEGDTVTITGSNFTDASLLSFGETEASSFTVDSDTEITAVVGNGASGDVLVTTPGGTATQAGFEFIPAPIIDAFDPASAAEGDTISITGSYFTDASLLSFGGTEAASFTVDSDTEITAVIGGGASGDVLVTTPGGTATLSGFTFTIPEIAVFNSDNIPIIDNQSDSVDFGTVFPDETLEVQLKIENIGSAKLLISNITSSDSVFEVLDIPDVIDPGSSAQFTLKFNPSDFGNYNSEINISNNSVNSPEFNFKVSAEFTDLNIIDNETDSIVISNQDINLGTTFINQNIDKVFEIENQSSNSTIEILRIEADNPVFQIINAPLTVPPLSSEEFTVRLNATAVGDYNGIVTIITSTNNFSFQVTGEVLEKSTDIKVYNVLTPNGDGRHDFLQIENITEFPNNNVSIFNRWGNKVFEINNYDNSSRIFEGISDKGEELITGNYYYVIDKGNGEKRITGFLIIKR
ncbi:MAG: BspA family leucine-rich repeat surface protein [Bacteroidota bacterium]